MRESKTKKNVVQYSGRNPWEKEVSATNAEGPPVPIPNTEVKLCSGEDTLRETARENSSMLTQAKEWRNPLPRLEKGREKANPKERSTDNECNSSFLIPNFSFQLRGCSSAGRAPALQAGGHGFESHHLHQAKQKFRSEIFAMRKWNLPKASEIFRQKTKSEIFASRKWKTKWENHLLTT